MKSIQSFNLSKENAENLEKYTGNKSALIDSLITRHFNTQKSEEELRDEFLELDRERNVAKARLDEAIGQRLRKERMQAETKLLSKEEEARLNRLSNAKYKWQNGDLSDDDYFKLFDESGKFLG